MTRLVQMSRYEAELIDKLLLEHVLKNKDGIDRRITWMARDLCDEWGMSHWYKRESSGITEAEWDKWNE